MLPKKGMNEKPTTLKEPQDHLPLGATPAEDKGKRKEGELEDIEMDDGGASGSSVLATQSPSITDIDIRGWSTEQLIRHLQARFPDDISDAALNVLREQKIRGRAFLMLTEEKLISYGMKRGPASVIASYVEVLNSVPLLPPALVAPHGPYNPFKRKLEDTLEPSNQLKLAFPANSYSNFKNLRFRNFFYVDKTKYIKDIENDESVLMFLRPKRFGKSLLLSTIRYFYDVNERHNFKQLFGSLEIYKHASGLRPNQFLILRWNFSKTQRTCIVEQLNRSLGNHVICSICEFCDKYANILGSPGRELMESAIASDPQDCTCYLERLFLLVQKTEYKIYLLIDEYDAITNELLDTNDTVSHENLSEKHSLLKLLFATIKDHCGEEIDRVFMTGVSPLAMNDITSGFNVRTDVTLAPRYEHMCGFKKEDIRHALESIFAGREELTDEEKKKSVDTHFEQMREYYNGYKFQPTKDDGVYNTNLCLVYFQNLLKGNTLDLVDPNNELSQDVLSFIGKHPDSTSLLTNLLIKKRISYKQIQKNIRLVDLVDIKTQDVDFLKSFLFYSGALTFTDQPGFLRLPNTVVTKTIIERILQLYKIQTSSDAFNDAADNLVTKGDFKLLASYLEPKLKEWIRLGNLYDDRELVTKMIFQLSLSRIQRYRDNTEVPVNLDGSRMGYIDLLLTETQPASIGARRKRFVFEFKSKGVNFLDLRGRGQKDWDVMETKAKAVEAMSMDELLNLKCGLSDMYDRGKTMKTILDDAVGQLKNYVEGLQMQDQGMFDIIAFAVLTVGSRKLLWKKLCLE